MSISCEMSGTGIKAVQATTFRTDPQPPCRSTNRLHTLSLLRLAAFEGSYRNAKNRPVAVSSRLSPAPFVPIQSVPDRSSRIVLTISAAIAVDVRCVVPVESELPSLSVKPAKPAVRCDPQQSPAVALYGPDQFIIPARRVPRSC